MIGGLIREPLFHFLLLGVLLFVGYGVVSRGKDTAPGAIVVTRGQIESVTTQFERTWQRQPTQAELEGLIANYVREEVLYREGVALGLDRDDPVIRNRVRLKMEVFGEGADAPEPTESDLQAWLAAHSEDFAIEPTFSFRQVYFDPSRHGTNLKRNAERVLAQLRRSDPSAVAFHLGDVTLLPAQMDEASLTDAERTFGKQFASGLAGLEPGKWQGPVASSYGLHLIQVLSRREGRLPALDEVREEVKREWTRARTREASERFYQDLRRRYTVTIEQPSPGEAPRPPQSISP